MGKVNSDIIGNVPLRLRSSSVDDLLIKEMFDNKQRYGCKTDTQLAKKALLYYKKAMDEPTGTEYNGSLYNNLGK